MDSHAQHLVKIGDDLFSKRANLLLLWQDEAEQFYPERADFTVARSLGDDFAGNLMTSYPVLLRRQLGDAFSSMLRPAAKDWFSLHEKHQDTEDELSRAWLEWATKKLRAAMYARKTGFTRAMKEADHDFATFGQAVISIEVNRDRTDLLYRCWHLRDVAWSEGPDGHIDDVHRKWKPQARTLAALFPRTVHETVRRAAEKEPFTQFDCRHVVTTSENYEACGGKRYRTPWVSVFIDVANGVVLEETGLRTSHYIIPRWQTVSGSQYAYSPATIAALPEARTIQAMTLTLLEAGEVGVKPPLVATKEALRSDIAYYAGGITYVDSDYDERKGDVLRPLETNGNGIPLGLDLMRDSRSIIEQCFYTQQIRPPIMGGQPEMTAYQTAQIVQQWILGALPLFEPMETETNAAVCEGSFDRLMYEGQFGPPGSIPRALQGRQTEFRFTSPLHEAVESQKGQKLLEASGLLAQMAGIDPTVVPLLKVRDGLRDAYHGIAVPAKWISTPEEMAEIDRAHAEQMAAQQMLGQMGQAAAVAKDTGAAAQSFAAAGAA